MTNQFLVQVQAGFMSANAIGLFGIPLLTMVDDIVTAWLLNYVNVSF